MKLIVNDGKMSGKKGIFMRIGKDINESAHIVVNGGQIIGDDMIAYDIQGQNPDEETLNQDQMFLIALLEKLEQSDQKECINLLLQLQNKNKEEAIGIVRKSTLLEKLGGTANVISITANLLALTANPSVQQLIASFNS